MQSAKYFKKLSFKSLQCTLCPRMCLIHENDVGFCKVRKNINHQLYSLAYGAIAGLKVDRLEYQGIHDFLPNTRTLVVGTFGCNMDCECCRREFMVRKDTPINSLKTIISPQEIIDMAKHFQCQSITFSYSEPTIYLEYAVDIAILAHKNGLKVCMFSNGFINDAPRIELYNHIDAATLDLKALSSNFYQHHCSSSIEEVLQSIKYFFSLNKHLELNTFIVPKLNDNEVDFFRMLNWISDNLSLKIPLHIESFYLTDHDGQINQVHNSTIYNLSQMAKATGFHKVYPEYN